MTTSNAIIYNDKIKIKDLYLRIKKLKKINKDNGFIIFLNNKNQLYGIITEGDIQNAIIKGSNINNSISTIINLNPVKINDSVNINDIESEIDFIKIKNKIKYNIQQVIIVDNKNKFLGIHYIEKNKNYKKDLSNRVTIIGLGHVGLTLCLGISVFNFKKIYGIDSNKQLITNIRKNIIPFHEKGLNSLLQKSNKKNLIEFNNDIKTIQSDVYILCVGTPCDKNNIPNLDYVKNAVISLRSILKKGDLIILRSTMPVGSTRNQILPLLTKNNSLILGKDYFLVFAPERLVEGNALEELRTLPQIIGGYSSKCTDIADSFFKTTNIRTIIVNSLEESELIKLTNNSFRDHVFSFSNAISYICDNFNINANQLIQNANEGYPRNKIPYASPGVGGICLSKDPYLLENSKFKSGKLFNKINIGSNSRNINSKGANFLMWSLNKFKRKYYKDKKIKIFVIGLAFKGFPETSDIRFSTGINFIKLLKKNKYQVLAYDLFVKSNQIDSLKIKQVSINTGFEESSAVFIVNNHPSYSKFNLNQYLNNIKKPFLFYDSWGAYDQKQVESYSNIKYATLGYVTK